MTRVLVTGGAGFVGSHACKALALRGIEPVVYDDLRRGNRWAVRWGPLLEASLEDTDTLTRVMRTYEVSAVMHFAAFAYVAESMERPSIYFSNNVTNTIGLLDAMVACGVDSLVVSSTCATYGVPPAFPITEDMPLAAINPYGASKAMMEGIAEWYAHAHGLRTVRLRYFNAAGADPDGEIGEYHVPEVHVIPSAIEAALGRRDRLSVNGTDYPTPDGTAVRDYVHVADLADAHVRALLYLLDGGADCALNLGSGCGTSIREIIAAVTSAVGRAPHVVTGPRRPGDPPELYARSVRARDVLGWSPARSDIDSIVGDAARWYRDLLPRYQPVARAS